MRRLLLLFVATLIPNVCTADLTLSISTTHDDGVVTADPNLSVVANVYEQVFTGLVADGVIFDATLTITGSGRNPGDVIVLGESDFIGTGATGDGFEAGIGVSTTNPTYPGEISERLNADEALTFELDIDAGSVDASGSIFTDVEFLGFNEIRLGVFGLGENATLTLDTSTLGVSGSAADPTEQGFALTDFLSIVGNAADPGSTTSFTVAGLDVMFQGIGSAAVPEPSSAMMVLGLLPILANRRRRRRNRL